MQQREGSGEESGEEMEIELDLDDNGRYVLLSLLRAPQAESGADLVCVVHGAGYKGPLTAGWTLSSTRGCAL